MNRLLLLLLFLLFPSAAQARSCHVAYYGIQHPGWPCEASIRALDPCTDIKVAFLAHTFGDETACLGRLLSDPRVSAVEIHLINERCQERPGGCGPYEFMAGLPMSEFSRLLKARDPGIMHRVGYFFTEMAGKFIPLLRPSTVCWVSPVLESKVGPEGFLTLAELAHWQFFQRCHVTYNPLNSGVGPHPWRFVYELHGNRPRIDPPCIADLDGMDIALDLANNTEEKNRKFYSSIVKEEGARGYVAEYAKCGASFLWVHEFNGRSKAFNDPRSRHNWPTQEIFNRVVSLFPGPAAPPSPPDPNQPGPAGEQLSFGGGMLHKPVAESGGNMVLLMPSKYCAPSKAGMRVQLVDRLGYPIENQLRFSGCTNPYRATHRSSHAARSLVPRAPLYYIWQYQGQQQWLKVPNPEQRYE